MVAAPTPPMAPMMPPSSVPSPSESPALARCSAARYAHASADSGGGAGGDAVRGHLPVGLHAAQDFARNAASRETVDSDELVRERAQAVGGHGRECGLGVLKRLVARLDEADL